MAFLLFILVNATLFIRPGEVVPDLEGWPIYQWVILSCLVVAYPRVFDQFTRDALVSRPVTVGVVGMWVAVVQYHGVIQMASLTMAEEQRFDPETGELVWVPRLRVVGTRSSESRHDTVARQSAPE
jgi:hypothetical protein